MIPSLIVEKLPSTAGKLAKNATNAGGVAFSISSNAFVVPPPTIETTGFDKLLDAVVLGRISIPTSQIRSATKYCIYEMQ